MKIAMIKGFGLGSFSSYQCHVYFYLLLQTKLSGLVSFLQMFPYPHIVFIDYFKFNMGSIHSFTLLEICGMLTLFHLTHGEKLTKHLELIHYCDCAFQVILLVTGFTKSFLGDFKKTILR